MFLEVQILGKGLIPRIGGIAPKYSLTKAPPSLIQTIMATPGLSLKYKNPETGELVPLTRQNLKAILDKYGNWTGPKNETKQESPVVPKINKTQAAVEVKEVIDNIKNTTPTDTTLNRVEETPVPEPVIETVKEEASIKDDIIVEKKEEVKIEEEIKTETSNNSFKPKYNDKKKK